jgi:hypothetical protein
MTTPVYPNQISALQIAAEFGAPLSSVGINSFRRGTAYVPSTQIGRPLGVMDFIPQSPGTQISYGNFHGATKIIPGNSGILTSGSSYTIPASTDIISIWSVGGGGGGGGGSWRNGAWQGYWNGGGGGGAGGAAVRTNIPVATGSTVTFSIGGGGGAGGNAMGQYSPRGSNGGSGGTTAAYAGGYSIVASGGVEGTVCSSGGGAQSAPGGGGGTYGTTIGVNGEAGQASTYFTTQGGLGGRGYDFNGTNPSQVIFGMPYGSNPGQYSSIYPTAGPGYGAGGTGGGVAQSDRGPSQNTYASSGTPGAVFIWWG